jgi:hypothetical protein
MIKHSHTRSLFTRKHPEHNSRNITQHNTQSLTKPNEYGKIQPMKKFVNPNMSIDKYLTTAKLPVTYTYGWHTQTLHTEAELTRAITDAFYNRTVGCQFVDATSHTETIQPTQPYNTL